jgi:uncharacterized DUF497 family protein
MKNTCSACTFLINITGLIPESALLDGVSVRCGKEERFVDGWPPPVRDPARESCEKFIGFNPQRSRWEWDNNKNQTNIQKHGISFEEATSALDSDNKSVRFVAKSWESLDSLDYEQAGIPRTFANTDPVRDLYLFKHNGKVWALVSTLRRELGLTTERVISARRARDDEQSLYERGLG